MGRDSFVFYKSFLEAAKKISDEERHNLFDAIVFYAIDGTDIEKEGIVDALFELIKPQIDANNHRYENGKTGGRKTKKPLVCKEENHRFLDNETIGSENKKPNENVNVNVNVNDNVNENVNGNENEEKEKCKKEKPVRHHRGEFGHVMLSDEEYNRLIDDYGEIAVSAGIKKVDEYCEEHGRRYANYNLALRKWGIDSPKLEESQVNTTKPRIRNPNAGRDRWNPDDPMNRERHPFEEGWCVNDLNFWVNENELTEENELFDRYGMPKLTPDEKREMDASWESEGGVLEWYNRWMEKHEVQAV